MHTYLQAPRLSRVETKIVVGRLNGCTGVEGTSNLSHNVSRPALSQPEPAFGLDRHLPCQSARFSSLSPSVLLQQSKGWPGRQPAVGVVDPFSPGSAPDLSTWPGNGTKTRPSVPTATKSDRIGCRVGESTSGNS